MFRTLIATLVIAATLGLSTTVSAQNTYYLLKFSTTENQVPETDFGPPTRYGISEVVFGSPLVVFDGAMPSRSLRFSPASGMEQIRLNMTDLPETDNYQLGATIKITESGNDWFSVFIDTPSFRKVTFKNDGNIYAHIAGQSEFIIGSYANDTLMRLGIDVDLDADTWTIYLGETELHSGPFGGANKVTGIRFTTANGSGHTAYLDDVVVTGNVPCLADLDGSGTVDAVDLLELLADWGACDGCPADIDWSSQVNISDLFALLAQWGDC